jgi:hypothetical protein
MLFQGPLVLGFSIGLIILFTIPIKRLRKYINIRRWPSYYIPYTLFHKFHKANYKKNRIESILLWASIVLVMAGIFAMIETHGSPDSQFHGDEGNTTHYAISKDK